MIYQYYYVYDKYIYNNKVFNEIDREGFELHSMLIYAGVTSFLFNIPFRYGYYYIMGKDINIFFNIGLIVVYSFWIYYKYIINRKLEFIVDKKPLFFNSKGTSLAIFILFNIIVLLLPWTINYFIV